MNETIFTMNQEIIKLVSDRTDFVLLDAPTSYVYHCNAINYINFSEDHGFSGHWFSDDPVYEMIDNSGNIFFSLKDESEDKTAKQIGTLEYWTVQISRCLGLNNVKHLEKIYAVEIIYEQDFSNLRYSYISQQFIDFMKKRRELLENFRYPTD